MHLPRATTSTLRLSFGNRNALLKAYTSVPLIHTRIVTRAMASKTQEPKILDTETFPSPAKWLKLEKIKYQDQEGKEVSIDLERH